MDPDRLRTWLDAYFGAWVSNDPDEVAALFTEHAEYRVSPFAEPWVGKDLIVEQWTAAEQRDVEWSYEPLAIDGDTALAHWRVTASDPDGIRRDRDGILLLRFTPDGRCRDHREWQVTREVPT